MAYELRDKDGLTFVVNMATGKVVKDGRHADRESATFHLALLENAGEVRVKAARRWRRKARASPAAFRVLFKAADGRRVLGVSTSNSYRDRDGEWVTAKALTEYVEKAWTETGFKSNPVFFWHDGPAIGDVIYAEMAGEFLLELVLERDNPFARIMFDEFERNPSQYKASWGFGALQVEDAEDGKTFPRVLKFETTILPHFVASNPHTFIVI